MTVSWLRCGATLAGTALALALSARVCLADPNADLKAGDFDRAAVGYAAILEHRPDDTGARRGLGEIRLYQNRLDDAQRLLARTVAENATDSRAAQLLAEVRARRKMLAGSDYVVSMPPGGVTVPFVATDPLPVLQLRVDGVDGLFFIDTGARDVVLDPAFARELGVQAQSAGAGIFAGGRTATVSSGRIDSLVVGDAVVRNIPVMMLPTRGLQFLPGRRIDGIVGTALLYHFLPTIDYPNGRLVLRSRSTSATFERKAAADRAVIVPMWLTGDHHIFARGRINDGPERLFNIDTGGAGIGVMASDSSVRDSQITLDETHHFRGIGGGGPVDVVPFAASVTLGPLVRNDRPRNLHAGRFAVRDLSVRGRRIDFATVLPAVCADVRLRGHEARTRVAGQGERIRPLRMTAARRSPRANS